MVPGLRNQKKSQGGPRRIVESVVLLTTAPQVPLLFQQSWGAPESSAQATNWKSNARSYCQKSGLNTVPLFEDSNYGFDVTSSQCRLQCEENSECKFYSHGRWEKGFGPPLGYYGKLRCQLYSKCDVGEFAGMSVFEKPDNYAEPEKPKGPEFRLLTASMVIFILSMLTIAAESATYLGRNGTLGVAFLAAGMSVMVIHDVGVKSTSYGIYFVALIAVHLINNVGRVALAFVEERPDPEEPKAEVKNGKGKEPEPRAGKTKPNAPGGDSRPAKPTDSDDSSDDAKESNGKKTVVDLTKSRSKKSNGSAVDPPTSSMPETKEDSSKKAARERKKGDSKNEHEDLSNIED